MQKSKGIKMAALFCGAGVAIVAVALVVSHFMKGQDSYRSILIYQLEGSADIEREGSGNIRAAEDLYLESGDRLTVADNSSVRLKLDDDKYVMAEENSILSIEAAGNEADSKTKIQLEQGAITNEIQNPLSTDSEYEVNSPNSVMAVRGTIFRVETEIDEEEEVNTKVSVFSGKVSMGALLEDGTIGDEILIGAGEEASCMGSTISGSVFMEPAAIDYQSFPLQTLNLLLELAERNAPLEGISAEELKGLVEEVEGSGDSQDVESTEDEEPVEDEESVEDAEEENSDDADDADDNRTNGSSSQSNTGSTGNTTNSGNNSGSNSGSNSGNKPTTTPRTNSGNNPGTTPGNNPGTTPGNNPGTTPGTTPGNNPGTTPGNDPGNNPGNDPQEQQKEYTVKFMYQGEVFATQTVKSGKCAKKPVLKPAKTGKWDFDFSKKIKKNTTIKWK